MNTDELYAAWSQLNPRDRQDARWYVSEPTLYRWSTARGWHPEDGPPMEFNPIGNRLFGIPVEVDDSLPEGEFRLIAETQRERELRRLAKEGVPIMVMPPMVWPEYGPPPTPTLKALVRHWIRKLKRR